MEDGYGKRGMKTITTILRYRQQNLTSYSDFRSIIDPCQASGRQQGSGGGMVDFIPDIIMDMVVIIPACCDQAPATSRLSTVRENILAAGQKKPFVKKKKKKNSCVKGLLHAAEGVLNGFSYRRTSTRYTLITLSDVLLL